MTNKRNEVILIGPPMAGKSTQGKLLAKALNLPQISLDDLRWAYFREIGYDDVLAEELRTKGGFLTVASYWSQFNHHAIQRVLEDHHNCVFDFGGGPIVFENTQLQHKISNALKPFKNVIHLLPSPDEAESIRVLQGRLAHLQGTNAQGFDWSSHFVKHPANIRLAKHHVFTQNQTPEQTCQKILKRLA